MRAGACAVQQTLSPEAASVLRHSLLLARRRRHAQLTPVHVAVTLLASSSAFAATLRRASPQGHPVHCRALELCFNVALNRLPAAAGAGAAPLLLQAQPSLSNAMVAALKRAQAHQRRSGCAELQQNCLVPIKIDLDQLILSILDDPSVSRAMREAGFSSTSVKTNLEDCKHSVPSVLLRCNFDLPSYPPEKTPSFLFPQHKMNLIPGSTTDFPSLTDYIEVISDILLGQRKKNVVVVGDSSSSAEGVVSEFMNKLENGDVREESLKSVKLIKLQFSTIPLGFMKKHEVDMNVGDLKRKVESFGLNGRVIICLGDLKWAAERESDDRVSDFDFSSIYRNPVDYLVTEIGKLVSWYNMSSNIRAWLMATADREMYMKCRMKKPSLDAQWDLEPVFVPSGGLGSSLNGMSCWDSRITSKSYLCPHKEHDNNFLNSCPDYTSNFEEENSSTQLPYWLKPHSSKQDLAQVRRTKYDKLCQNLHNSSSLITKNHYKTCLYPCWPNKTDNEPNSRTIFFSYPSLNPNQNPTSVPRFRRKQQSGFDFSIASAKNQPQGPNLDSLKGMEGKEVEITLSLGNFRDHKKICDLRGLIQENVPWQCETIPMIVDSLVEYCSREIEENGEVLFIEGNDFIGKRRLAVGIAKSVFGSPDMFFCMNMRHNENYTVVENCEILEMALRKNEKVVILIENVDYADQEFVEFLMAKKGSCRVIFVLTTDGDRNGNWVIPMKLQVSHQSKHGLSMSSFLDGRKRKIDWDFPNIKGTNQRKKYDETEEVSSNGVENVLDLNIKAHDDEEQGNLSSISSDLTREITIKHPDSLTFLKTIKTRFVLDRASDKDEKAKEMFLSKFKRTFHNATNYAGFEVEEDLLEEVFRRSGFYLNDLFGEWLNDIFQTSLSMAGAGDYTDENVSVRLCLDGKLGEKCCEKDGFKGTSLPKRVPLCFHK